MAKTTRNTSVTFEELLKKFELAKYKGKISDYLYDYFISSKEFNNKFLNYLAENHAEYLIDAVRKSQVYLRFAKFKQLLYLEDSGSKYVCNYIKAFKFIANEEHRLFTEIKTLLNVFDQCNPVAVLNIVAFWFESKRALIFANCKAGGGTYDITPKIETVNFFLTHYFKITNTEEEFQNASSNSLAQYSLRVLESDFTSHPTWRILELIDDYLFFLNGIVEIFSFDSNYVLNVTDNTATLSFHDIKKREKWNEEDAKIFYRYETLKQQAESNALKELGIAPDHFKYNNDFSLLLEFTCSAKKNITIAAANDYYLLNSSIDRVPTNILVDYLSEIVLESYRNYVFEMDLLNQINPMLWDEHLKHNILQLEHTDEGGCPVIIVGNEMVERVQNYYKIDAEMASKLVSLISNDISAYQYPDRLNPKINLLGKPFIKICNVFIGIRPVIGESVNHLNAAVNIMECNHDFHQDVEKKEAGVMERSIMEMFRTAGFQNMDCSIEIIENCLTKMEYDLLVYENGVLFLAEIKRSKPRVLPSDVNNELLKSLNKASEQLDERLKYIRENFSDFKSKYCQKLKLNEGSFNELTVFPIIISTSLEQDHVFIRDKHLKISLFELKGILNSFSSSSGINNLKYLIDFIVNNEFWKSKNLLYERPGVSDRMLTFKL